MKYLERLHQSKKLKKGKMTAAAPRPFQRKPDKKIDGGMTGPIDMFASHSEVSDVEGSEAANNSYDVQYQLVEKRLTNELFKCRVCNANKDDSDKVPCLIDKQGMHRSLNNEMIRTWIYGIVSL